MFPEHMGRKKTTCRLSLKVDFFSSRSSKKSEKKNLKKEKRNLHVDNNFTLDRNAVF